MKRAMLIWQKIKTREIIDGVLKEIEVSMIEASKKEEHLEKWIKTNPTILREDILIIGEQVPTKAGPLDFLGMTIREIL